VNLDLSVYLVTDPVPRLADLVAEAVAGGVTAVQLRDKHAGPREFLAALSAVAEVLPPAVPLIVNDRVDVFLAARVTGIPVAGLHLGQDDLPVPVVRTLVGPQAVLGLSAATRGELAEADASGADYVGIGALHPTGTKTDAPPALGLDGFAALVATTRLPAVAIGGVTAADLPHLRAAGAAGAAVVSAICAAADHRAAARELANAWRQHR
jgi:thiamine-phosphate diphosphorylase